MKRVVIGFIVASALIGGCGSSGGSTSAESTTGKSESSAPVALTKSDKLEVAAFKGGYGIDFYQEAAKGFSEKTKDKIAIDVSGDPRVWEKLKPRFVGGNPPDLTLPGWGMDHWALAEEDQLLNLDSVLKTKNFEETENWGDTFEPALLKLGQLEGKQFVLPYYVNLWGWWYDPGLFAKNGWTPPKTYADLLAVCEKIKAKGIAPLTYQGQYPYYMIQGMLLPWVVSVGGTDALKSMENLEPGAWKSPAVLQAAKMIHELKVKGYFQSGATAMSHTESQQEFLQGKAAMIPCGTWLYAEMKNVMPPNTKIEFMVPPSVAGKGDPTSLQVAIEPWMIPAKAKNQDGAIRLFKYMTSKSVAQDFVKKKGTLVAIKGSADIELPDVLKVPAKVFKESKSVYAIQFRQWYPTFETEIENALTAMLNGDATPEQFCDRMEAAAEKTRNDPNVSKHKL